ncbi:ubiquitin C-terminal hydrolase 37 [Aspergillus lucknowensis]|uniref:Ubiquitin carboxyl-terminal hydrolase n=1 Tax=Aspergillus lucknowensis TaxID=176173 RepID=A0ABR4LEF2_9EURO
MSERVKRRRLNDTTDNVDSDGSCRPDSGNEKSSWNGFCELESEPALFNVMLREFGVTGVKVQEVVSLDDEFLACLNKPVYGLIFLFRWREDDPDKQEASCPDGLWFANQTAGNACASVALLNIVNNIEGIDLGENLRSFKDFTMPFTPALRGDAISNFEFVKRIHNSFARQMDILNSDLHLKHEATSKRNRSKKRGRDEGEADAGFHFIAFVPALGKVWKFDGLERQPQALGAFGPDSDWLDLVKPNIRANMEEYEEDQIEFSILSLARDPLPDLVEKLALNIKQLEAIERAIASHGRDEGDVANVGPRAIEPLPENTLLGPDKSYGVTENDLRQISMSPEREQGYLRCTMDELAQHREEQSRAQIELRATVREEQQSQQADDDYAAGRRYDYGPAIRTWLRFLARKQIIEGLIPKAEGTR